MEQQRIAVAGEHDDAVMKGDRARAHVEQMQRRGRRDRGRHDGVMMTMEPSVVIVNMFDQSSGAEYHHKQQ